MSVITHSISPALFSLGVQQVRDNLVSQSKLLPALVEENARLAHIRGTVFEVQAAQKLFVDDLVESGRAFVEVRQQLLKGTECYEGLITTIATVWAKTGRAPLPLAASQQGSAALCPRVSHA